MEENINIEEQPQSVESFDNKVESMEGSSNVNPNVVDEKQDSSEAERGVPVGKFKSVEDLYEAYNNLQAEFTRKSQRLSVLEKEKMSEEPSTKMEANFETFLSKNPEAFAYSEEIESRLLQNESLKNDANAYEKVWTQLIFEKLSSPNKSKEPLVQNLILKDNELKNLVIENYMKQLTSQKTPFVMSSDSGERVTKTVAQKPDSFEQAKKVVLDLLS